MQLREPETLGVLDDHDRCVGHVDPHLDDGGGHKHVYLTFTELTHDASLLGALHAAREQSHAQLREHLGAQALVLASGRTCLGCL